MELEEIFKSYVEKHNHYKTQMDRFSNQMGELQEKMDQLEHPSWIEEIVRTIAHQLVEHFPGRNYEILGPFGMNADTSLHFEKIDIDKKERYESDNIVSITFRPIDLSQGLLSVVDHSVNIGRFKEGTIAALNGGNYNTVPIVDWTIDDLLKWVK